MAEDKKQIHLAYGKPGFSGRAVRFRMLTASESSHIKEQLAHAITPETTNAEFDSQVADAGVDKMVIGFTEPVSPEKLADAKWESIDTDAMMGRKAAIFTAKDIDLLKKVYLSHHHVSPKELEDIMGGIVGFVD